MAVTIKDIAKVAGVSHTTVSRALHDHPGLPETTITHIKDLAEEMGYIPSAAARSLKTRHSLALGVIVSYIDDPFWSEVIQGIDDVLHLANYSLFIAATLRDSQREKEVIQSMVQRGVDGVILCAPQFGPDQSRFLKSFGLPIVIVNNEGASDSKHLVFNDDVHGICLATKHLIELGHQKIAYLGVMDGGRTAIQREKGFRKQMAKAGLQVDERFIYQANRETPEDGFAGARYLLSFPDRPTAVVCYNDYMVAGVYSALYEVGLKVPQDISVIGFDDIKLAAYLTPPLTTVRQLKSMLGANAATMMLNLLEKKKNSDMVEKSEKIGIKGELVIRKSTAPLNEDARE